MMLGNIGFMDLRQSRGQYCCLRFIKLHIALITGPYLCNIDAYLPCGPQKSKTLWIHTDNGISLTNKKLNSSIISHRSTPKRPLCIE